MKLYSNTRRRLFSVFSLSCVLFPVVSFAANFECSGGDVTCLINAIRDANLTSEADTINLDGSTFVLTGTPVFMADGSNGLPDITSNITINGASFRTTAIQRDGNASFFRIFHVAASGTLTLNELRISLGHIQSNTGGGGIFNLGTLTVTNSIISENIQSGDGGFGGGIFNQGTVDIANSLFVENSGISNGRAGAVFNSGIANITNSTFSENSAIFSTGGILNNPTGTMTVTGSTFSGNTSQFGGGIVNDNILTIINSTFFRNGSQGGGGGVQNFGGTLTVINSTFSENLSDGGGGGISGQGVGMTLRNTIIADSLSPSGNCSIEGGTIDGGYNIDSGETCHFSTMNNSLPNTPPMLDPMGLKNNGGPTPSIGLLPGSPAINRIPTANCTDARGNLLATDQTGFLRPAPPNGNCDIGAFEAGAAPPASLNSFGSFERMPSTTTSDTSGCFEQPVVPPFVGKFSFSATLTNTTSTALSRIIIEVATLTNGNLLLNAVGGPGGVGTTFAIPRPQAGPYSDGILRPNEQVDVPFIICLKNLDPFVFLVNVLGNQEF